MEDIKGFKVADAGEMSAEQRAEVAKSLRRILAKVEEGKEDDVQFVFAAVHKEDLDDEGKGPGVTGMWGCEQACRALAHSIVKELMPPELRKLIEGAEKRIEALNVAVDKANSKDGIALPRGLNPEDADAAKLLN